MEGLIFAGREQYVLKARIEDLYHDLDRLLCKILVKLWGKLIVKK